MTVHIVHPAAVIRTLMVKRKYFVIVVAKKISRTTFQGAHFTISKKVGGCFGRFDI